LSRDGAAVCLRWLYTRASGPQSRFGSRAESMRTRAPSIIAALSGATRARSSVTNSLSRASLARSTGACDGSSTPLRSRNASHWPYACSTMRRRAALQRVAACRAPGSRPAPAPRTTAAGRFWASRRRRGRRTFQLLGEPISLHSQIAATTASAVSSSAQSIKNLKCSLANRMLEVARICKQCCRQPE
jgi:hypothetical protein